MLGLNFAFFLLYYIKFVYTALKFIGLKRHEICNLGTILQAVSILSQIVMFYKPTSIHIFACISIVIANTYSATYHGKHL